jgi:glycosyltransferase involved in cell wall biosynthesis
MLSLSLILPTYEEEEITDAITRLSAAVCGDLAKGGRPEIVVVDDSRPETRERMVAWASEWNRDVTRAEVRILEGPHRGKGAAVREGAKATRGGIVFVMDADLPIPLERIAEFARYIDDGRADVVIGERPMSRNTGNPVRFVLSRGLYAFQWAVVFQKSLFDDTQCGFKAFRGSVLRHMASQQVVDGGMYDIEYLYMATTTGLRIQRVPVVPNPESRPSKINVKKAMLRDPADLFRVKWKGLRGGYK